MYEPTNELAADLKFQGGWRDTYLPTIFGISSL
jgi:hypothetical protein